jgi:hypothetical protein
MHVKGMVQVDGVTYRLVRVSRGTYQVVRILDDVIVGSFQSLPRLAVTGAQGVDAELMERIARAALQGAKTSWVARLSFT